MCQFRDNILVASNADPSECRELVSLMKSVVENARGLLVESSCADAKGNCAWARS